MPVSLLLMSIPPRILITAALLALVAPVAQAHFKMLEPAGWIVESDRGDPQKAGPCGGDGKGPGTATSVVGKAVGGSALHIKVLETIYHPGHYRVALAVNSRDELPPDPQTTTRDTDKGPYSVWAVIQSPAQIPVIADGLFPHYARPPSPQTFETDVQLPNISCKKCTLQVVQWMAEHAYNNPGGYTYHHCADLEITADPGKPLDKGWPESR
jgi:hypothetical protein